MDGTVVPGGRGFKGRKKMKYTGSRRGESGKKKRKLKHMERREGSLGSSRFGADRMRK